MSSLQQQLAVIAAQSTHQLDLKAQKLAHGKSLLFDPKIAASQDFNSIYQICLEGFQELCMLDARFSTYATTIFNEQSKDEERTQMTQEQNKELDAVLESFLSLIGSFLLLKPAIVAMEWLVRRFRVHEYNTEAVLHSFLQYHSAPMFATLLSILPKQLPQVYRFLRPYISQLQNPPRTAIIYSATKDPNLFTSYSRYVMMVTEANHQSSNLLSFWATVAAQTINGMLEGAMSGIEAVERKKQEEVLLLVLPMVRDALILKHAPELQLACFMIIAIIANKTVLADRVVDGLMETVVGSWTEETIDGGLVCLSVLSEDRKNARLTRVVIRKLMKVPQLAQQFRAVSEQCRCDRLALGTILGILNRLDKHANPEAIRTIADLLGSQIMGDAETTTALKAVFGLAQDLENHPSITPDTRAQLSELITALVESDITGKFVKDIMATDGLDLDRIEMNLNTIVNPQSATLPEPQQMDLDHANERPAINSFEDSLSTVPERTASVDSFLAEDSDKLLATLLPVFLQGTSSSHNLNLFLQLPVLSREGRYNCPLFFSFLTRIWCGPHPVLARLAALESLLKSLKEERKSSVDLQALIPYLLYALTDQSAKVRQSAGQCVLALEHTYEQFEKASSPPIWASENLYQHLKPTALSSTDAAKFLSSVVVPSLAECTMDSQRIGSVLEAALNGDSHSIDKGSFAKLKSSLRSSLCAFLASHAVHTPLLRVRAKLLPILSKVGKAGSHSRAEILNPGVQAWISAAPDVLVDRCKDEHLNPDTLLDAYMSVLNPRENDGLLTLVTTISSAKDSDNLTLVEAAFRRIDNVWPDLKPEQCLVVGDLLWKLSIVEDDSTTQVYQEMAQNRLRTLSLPSDVLTGILGSLPDASGVTREVSPAKRRRTSHSGTVKLATQDSTDISSALRQITLALELIESSGPQKHPKLLPGLFHLLGELQQFRAQTGSDLVYLQNLTLGSLLSVVNKLKHNQSNSVERSAIRTDLLVDSIRTTSSPQVQNAALLLISSLAVWVPDLVLHSVMPIFTFMSTTLLRQGDDYSAHVIRETISRVIPPLVTSLRKRGQDLVAGAAEILLSFTAAFEHIPYQRRLGLFTHLSKTLGSADSLFAIIAMLVDKYPSDKRARQFTVDLIQEFDPSIQLETAGKYLSLLADCLKPRRGVSEVVFGIKARPADSLDDILQNLMDALSGLIKHGYQPSKFLNAFTTSAVDDTAKLHEMFSEVVAQAIQLLKNPAITGQLQNACRLVLSTILDLLPTAELLSAVTTLVGDSDDDIRRYVLRSLEVRVEEIKSSNHESRTAILGFLPQITTIVEQSPTMALKRSAVSCIDRIAEKLGKKEPSTMITAAEVVSGEQALGSDDAQLQASSLFCLATICEATKESFVPLLPTVIPKTFQHLEASINAENESLNDAAYAVISTVIEHIPYMFSGQFLGRALELSQILTMSNLGEDSPESRLHFYQLASRRIDAKQLFTAIRNQWDSATAAGYAALVEHLQLLARALERQPKSAVVKNCDVLFETIRQALDFRRLRYTENLEEFYSEEQVSRIEHMVNEVTLAVTMKLNDNVFRPFFFQLVDWSSTSLPKADAHGRALRSTSLFVFVEAFIDRLKGLVTSYSSYILDLATEVLQGAFADTSNSDRLLEAVIRALTKSFEHDQDDFWQSPSHFGKVVAPLIQQLETATPSLANTTVVPAVTALATTASSADHHKDIDTAILKLTRHDSAQVRLRAVKTQQSLTERLGDEWLSLLPEMLPFISELQEDDDEDVEKETRRWIKAIEEVLGEDLDEMLQ